MAPGATLGAATPLAIGIGGVAARPEGNRKRGRRQGAQRPGEKKATIVFPMPLDIMETLKKLTADRP